MARSSEMERRRYEVIQPNAPSNLRGAIYTDRLWVVGDVLPKAVRGEVEFWQVVEVREGRDSSWAGLLRFEYAPPEERPELTQEERSELVNARRATAEDFEPWSDLLSRSESSGTDEPRTQGP
jgi:hypothetical protein